jgi:hypothetical protein
VSPRAAPPLMQMPTAPRKMSEEEAKRKWLASLEQEPSWKTGRPASAPVEYTGGNTGRSAPDIFIGGLKNLVQEPFGWLSGKPSPLTSTVPTDTEFAVGYNSVSAEEAAAARAAVSEAAGFAEQAAREARLAEADAAAWAETVQALDAVAVRMAQLEADCNEGLPQACDTLSREEEARAAWMAATDAPKYTGMVEDLRRVDSQLARSMPAPMPAPLPYTPPTSPPWSPPAVAKPKADSEAKKLMQQVKEAGVAGAIAYAGWELFFWAASVPVCLVAYYGVTGHFPDLNDQEDMAKLGAEAFAFVNVARFAVPLRIGLALGSVPFVQTQILDRFFPKSNDQ